MKNLQSETVEDRMWASLEAVVEEQEISSHDWSGVEPEQTYLLGDRMAHAYLSGFLPLYLLAAALLLISGPGVDIIIIVGGALLSLFTAAFCQPLTRNSFGASPLRLALVAPFFCIIVLFQQMVPAFFYHSLTAEKSGLISVSASYFLAQTVQKQLGQILQWPETLALLAVTALLAFGLQRLRRRRPWVEPGPVPKPFQAAALLLLLTPYLAPVFFFRPDPQLGEWKQRVGAAYQQCFVASLADEKVDGAWRTLYEEVEDFRYDSDTSGRPRSEQLSRLREFESRFYELLKTSPPSTKSEFDYMEMVSQRLLVYLPFLAHPAKALTISDGPLFRGNRYGYWTRAWLVALPRWIGDPERTVSELETAEQLIIGSQEAAISNQEELDLIHYAVYNNDRRRPDPPKLLKVSPVSGVSHSDYWDPGPVSMKVFGYRTVYSPTYVLERWKIRRFLQAWLDLRSEFKEPIPDSRKELLQAHMKPVKDEASLKKFYMGWAASHSQTSEYIAARETALVYLREKLFQLEKDRLATLEDLGLPKNGPWKIETTYGGVYLTDSRFSEMGPVTPWRLR